MSDTDKTKEHLIDQVSRLRGRVAELEKATKVRKLTDKKLCNFEEHYKTLVEITGDGLAILQNGFIVFASKRLCEILKISSDKIVGVPFSRFFLEDELPRITELYQRYVLGESELGIIETKVAHPDGTRIFVEINGARYMYEGKEAVLLSLRDVSEKNEFQRTLQESEENYRRLMKYSTDVIWTLDMEQNFTYVSPSIEKIYGYTVEQALANRLEDIMPPESLKTIRTDDSVLFK